MVTTIDALCANCGKEIRVSTGDYFLCGKCYNDKVINEIDKDVNNWVQKNRMRITNYQRVQRKERDL